jgi:alginate O-acetyltransferase complex protein AlgJ
MSTSDPLPVYKAPAGGRVPERLLDRLVSIALVAILAGPGIALIVGLRSPLIENRAATTVPPLTLDAMSEPGFFATVDQAISEAFPLRAAAVQARAVIDYDLLRGSPNPDVIVGRGPWLFLAGEIRPKCLWHADEILQTWDSFAADLAEQGIAARFLIVPDKHTVYPEMLPLAIDVNDLCTTAERSVMEAGMDERSTTVDLWRPVLEASDEASDEARYFQADSHWTPSGAMPAIRALAESLEPGLWDLAPPEPSGQQSFVGDLSRLLGLPSTEVAATFDRFGVSLSVSTVPSMLDSRGRRPVQRLATSGTDILIPGRTLILYDSFFGFVQTDVAAWFAESIWLHIDDLSLHPEVVRDLPPFDRVVLARTERLAYLTDYAKILQPLIDR